MLTVLRHSQRHTWKSECRIATGRSAIRHLISVTAPKAVLMPCYVPEGVIIPFQRAGVPIKFYKLRADLRPDLDHVSRVICKGALVVIINYFGYQTETGALREIVSNTEGILFEDCAHALFAKASDADVALWSFNKFLPVVDGAILKSRRRDIDVTPMAPFQQPVPSRVMNPYHQHLGFNARLAVCSDPTQALELKQQSDRAYEEYYKNIQDFIPYEHSAESRCIVASTNLDEVKQTRSYNAATYYRNLPESMKLRSGIPVAPFAFPILVKSPDQVLQKLLEIGVLASKAIDKWDHIPDDHFEAECYFRDHHLLLPVGEEVTFDDIHKICECLKGLT